jgi:hypothetical protein
MLKILKAGTTEIPCKFTLESAIMYQSDFGRDLFADLGKIYDVKQSSTTAILEKAKGKIKFDTLEKLQKGDKKAIKDFEQEMLGNVDFAEALKPPKYTVEMYINGRNIMYCFAKTANVGLPDVEKWFNSFEHFPITDFCDKAFECLSETMRGTVEIKNA